MGVAINDASTLFQKCAPSIRTNIGECGTVTLCQNVQPETATDLETIYTKNGDYRLLEHLFKSHFEIKACGAVQHSMRDFFIANAQVTRKGELRFDKNDEGISIVAPFIMAEQKKPINNIYWRMSNFSVDGSGNLTGHVYSGSGIPADVRSFPPGCMMFLSTQSAGGSKINSQYTVNVNVPPTLSSDGTYVSINLTPVMTGSFWSTSSSPAQISTDMTALNAVGIIHRGVVNVGKTESYCEDEPAYRNDNLAPFWIQHTRWTSCSSSLYNKWLGLVLDNNPLYRDRIYISEVERMRQKGEAFERRLFDTLWYQQPISSNQNLTEYTALPQVTNFISNTGLGVEGAKCYGFKANCVGWLTQLRECNRWYDAQGAALNMYGLFNAIYNMRRVRAGIGSSAQLRFDLFTDGITAELIDKGFIGYYGNIFQGKDRYNVNIDDQRVSGENKEYGIQFVSYKLRERNNGVTLNVITDWAFDDKLSEFTAANMASGGRTLMMLDLTGIYMKVIESNKVNNHTGDLKALVAVDSSFACVEETETRDTVLNGLTFTAVVECPLASLVIDNFSGAIPGYDPNAAIPNYDGTSLLPYEGGIVQPYTV
jgi:hypothetical protein